MSDPRSRPATDSLEPSAGSTAETPPPFIVAVHYAQERRRYDISRAERWDFPEVLLPREVWPDGCPYLHDDLSHVTRSMGFVRMFRASDGLFMLEGGICKRRWIADAVPSADGRGWVLGPHYRDERKVFFLAITVEDAFDIFEMIGQNDLIPEDLMPLVRCHPSSQIEWQVENQASSAASMTPAPEQPAAPETLAVMEAAQPERGPSAKRTPRYRRGELDERATAELMNNPRLTNAQIAEILGCNPDSLKSKKLTKFHAARETLKRGKERYRRPGTDRDEGDERYAG